VAGGQSPAPLRRGFFVSAVGGQDTSARAAGGRV